MESAFFFETPSAMKSESSFETTATVPMSPHEMLFEMLYRQKAWLCHDGRNLAPNLLTSNPGHTDSTLDWHTFHKEFPHFEYCTEEMIDFDTDAYVLDEFFCDRAFSILLFIGPFLDVIIKFVRFEAAKLERDLSKPSPDQSELSLRQQLRYLDSIPELLKTAQVKALIRFGHLVTPGTHVPVTSSDPVSTDKDFENKVDSIRFVGTYRNPRRTPPPSTLYYAPSAWTFVSRLTTLCMEALPANYQRFYNSYLDPSQKMLSIDILQEECSVDGGK